MTNQSKSEALAQFLATRGVTRCAPADGNARPLRAMRRDHESNLTNPSDCEFDAERASERSREAFGAARANGASMSDALDDARDAHNGGF